MQSFSLKVSPARRPIFIPTTKGSSLFSYTRPHIFHILTEEGVAAEFLRTVADDVESARAFVSKNSNLDLDALHHILECSPSTMVGLKKATGSFAKSISTRSILLQNCILHLHMVEEPDQFGPWKIFGVDKESR